MNTQVTLGFVANSLDEFKAAVDALRTLPATAQGNVFVHPPAQSTSGRGPWESRWIQVNNADRMTRSREEKTSGKDRETIARERCEREGITLDNEPSGEYEAEPERFEAPEIEPENVSLDRY